MPKRAFDGASEVRTVLGAVLFDVPVAAGRWGLGIGTTDAISQAAWKGYDATIRIGSVSIDGFYRNGMVASLMGRSFEAALRWQRLNQTVGQTLFAAVWHSVGLPTAADVAALREEVRSLASRLEKGPDARPHPQARSAPSGEVSAERRVAAAA